MSDIEHPLRLRLSRRSRPHGSQFDVHNGKVKAGPAEKPISTYEVDQTGGEV